MSNFDIALGLSQAAMNQISDGFYQRGKDTIYKGSVTKDDVEIDWAALSAPVFDLSPPSQADAQQIVETCDLEGKYPHLHALAAAQPETKQHVAKFMTSASNAFSFTIKQLQLTFKKTITITVPLVARGTISNSNNVTQMNLLGVSITVEGSVNQALVNKLLIPEMTKILAGMLNGFQIPPLQIEGLSIGATNAAVTGGKIVIFGNLSSNPTAPSIDGFSLPGTDFFALLDARALTAQVNNTVGGKTFGPKGSKDVGIGTAEYHATVAISNPVAAMEGNDLSINMALTGSAGAGVKIGCTEPGIGFNVYAKPDPTVSCALAINGSAISVHATSCSSFASIVTPSGVVSIILAPVSAIIGTAIASAVTATFSSQIVSLVSFPSMKIPSMPVHYDGITMTISGTSLNVQNVSGCLGIEGKIAIA